MLICEWITFGILASFAVYALFPYQVSGTPAGLIVLITFIVLGLLDYLASVVTKKTGRSRLRWGY